MSKAKITDKPVDADPWAAFETETGAFYSQFAAGIERPWAEWAEETDAIFTKIAANIAAPSDRFQAAIEAAYAAPAQSPDKAPLGKDEAKRK